MSGAMAAIQRSGVGVALLRRAAAAELSVALLPSIAPSQRASQAVPSEAWVPVVGLLHRTRPFSGGQALREAGPQEAEASALPAAGEPASWENLPLPQFIYHKKEKRAPATLAEAITFVKGEAAMKNRRFTETVDLAICLGINPKRGDHTVRSSVSLPHGTGKSTRVGVFVPPEEVEAALAAGADVAGSDDLIAHVVETGGGSKMKFDKVLATPDMMKPLSKVARILGPRGLMPNPKLGTIVQPSELAEAIGEMKRGRVEFRADKGAVIHVPIGKVDFESKKLMENAGALVDALLAARPAKLKGSGSSGYILKVSMSSTMGPSTPVLVKSLVAARPAKP